MAETVNGYHKTELVRGPARSGPQKTIEDLELATLGWVHWHNTQRLHGYLGDIPPAEFEASFYAGQTGHSQLGENQIARAFTKPRAVHRGGGLSLAAGVPRGGCGGRMGA